MDLSLEQMFEMIQKPSTAKAVDYRKCLCGKLLKREEFSTRWYSGIINYDEVLCAECRKTYSELSRVVCLGCRSLQGFVEPHKASTGFEFERKHHYHIAKCPRCDSSIAATPVLEHEAHCRARGVAPRRNLDLVQEIEQKSLQGRKDAERLRAEIQASAQR